MNIFQDYWSHFHELGYNVLPVTGKRPLLKGWEHWNNNRQSEEDVEDLLLNYVGPVQGISGIGIPLGPHGGLAIDIDVYDDDTTGFLDEAKKLLFFSNMIRRGEKGFVAFFAPDPTVLSAKLHKETKQDVIEIFSTSGQVVVPPSRHPDVPVNYSWINGTELVDISELVPWHAGPAGNNLFEKLSELILSSGVRKRRRVEIIPAAGVIDGRSVVPEGGAAGRFNRLSPMAFAKAKAGVPVDQAVAELLAFDRAAHATHLDKDGPYFECKRKFPGKRTPAQNAEAFYLKALRKAESAMVREFEDAPVLMPKVAGATAGDDTVATLPTKDPFEYEEELSVSDAEEIRLQINKLSLAMIPLFTKGSLLESFRIVSSARGMADVPSLQMSSALALMSILASNVVESGDCRANGFFISIADSGIGKGAPQKLVTDILQDAENGHRFYGQARYRSVPIMFNGLTEKNTRHARIDIHDEVSDLFKGMREKTLASAGEALSNLWSASVTFLGEQTTMDKNRSIKAMWNPYITWLGSSTPAMIRGHVTAEMMTQGLGPRIAWFLDAPPKGAVRELDFVYGYRKKDENEAMEVENAYQRLVDVAGYWLSIPPQFAAPKGNAVGVYNEKLEAGRKIVCRQLVPDDVCLKEMKRIQDASSDMAQEHKDNGSPLYGRYERRAEMIRKFAICHWIATVGALEAECFGADIDKEPHFDVSNILWAEQLFDILDQMFDVFMDMNSASLGLTLKGSQIDRAIRADTVAWLKAYARQPVAESVFRKRINRLIDKHDKNNEIRDSLVFYARLKKDLLDSGDMVEDRKNRGASVRYGACAEVR